MKRSLRRHDYLLGAEWCWAKWVEYDDPIEDASAPGGIRVEHQDHDHCSICYDTAFSARFEGDLREGWTTAGPRGKHIGAARDAYYWVCAACFDELREQFSWTTR
jgi:hypothetical protein